MHVVQETSTPDAAWPALVEAFQLFLLGSGDPSVHASAAAPAAHDFSSPSSPSASKPHLSNGPTGMDEKVSLGLTSIGRIPIMAVI